MRHWRERRAVADAPERAPADSAVALASTLGNRGFAGMAQAGAGILPDGRAHPEVEAADRRPSQGVGACRRRGARGGCCQR